MKVLILLLLVGLASGAPTFSENGSFTDLNITEAIYLISEKIYTSKHDIVKIVVPPIRFYNPPNEKIQEVPLLFFVQGDYKEDGTFDSKGLFVLKIKTGEATKLLDNGEDITLALNDNTKKVYFAATNGIYIYNAENNTAEKFGSVNDKIISIAKAKTGDAIYALNAGKELYEVTESGEKKMKVDDVKNSHQIVLDNKDNIYFYDDEKKLHIYTKKGLITIDELPGNPKKIILLEPIRLGYSENCVPVFADDKIYLINEEKGTLRRERIVFLAQPTAMSLSGHKGRFFGYKKNIYQTFR